MGMAGAKVMARSAVTKIAIGKTAAVKAGGKVEAVKPTKKNADEKKVRNSRP